MAELASRREDASNDAATQKEEDGKEGTKGQ